MVEKIPFVFAELFGEDIADNGKVAEGQLSLFELTEENMQNKEIRQVRIKKVYTLGE